MTKIILYFPGGKRVGRDGYEAIGSRFFYAKNYNTRTAAPRDGEMCVGRRGRRAGESYSLRPELRAVVGDEWSGTNVLFSATGEITKDNRGFISPRRLMFANDGTIIDNAGGRWVRRMIRRLKIGR